MRNLDGGIGNDRHRAHRREVMAADRQRQQNGAADFPFRLLAMKTDGKRDGADYRSRHNRRDDKCRIPQDDALDFKGRHAGVVHRRDATGDNGAANPWPEAPVWRKRYREPCPGQQDGGDQRQHGQGDIVAARDSRCVGKHCDEMRCPDAEAGRDRRYHEPYVPHAAIRFAGVAKQVDRGERRQDADEGGECHKLQIMGSRDAIIDLEHEQVPQWREIPRSREKLGVIL